MIYNINIGNAYTYLEGFENFSEDIKEELLFLNSYFDKNAKHCVRYKEGKWDGRKYFLTEKGRLSTGLLSDTIRVLKKYGETKLNDYRTKPEEKISSVWEWLSLIHI